MPSTSVLNLSTGDSITYTCEPREAVIAAYAQSLGDYNTWDYAERYGNLVTEGRVSIACGDFSAMKEATARIDLSKCEPFRSTLRFVSRWLPYDNHFYVRNGSIMGSKSLIKLFVHDVLEQYKGYVVELVGKEEYLPEEEQAINYLRTVTA